MECLSYECGKWVQRVEGFKQGLGAGKQGEMGEGQQKPSMHENVIRKYVTLQANNKKK